MKHIVFGLCLIAPLMLAGCAGGRYHHHHGDRSNWNYNHHDNGNNHYYPQRPMPR